MKAIASALLVLLLFSSSFAGPKRTTREFDASCQRLWKAAKIAAKAHYDVLNLNDQDMYGAVNTGILRPRALTFQLSGDGDKCTIAVGAHMAGVIGNDKSVFFDRVQSALKDLPQDEVKKP